MTTRWIGPDPLLAVGDMGFLVENYNESTGGSQFFLRDTPAYTNRSHEPRLSGWCGTWNNIGTHGHGMARVIRVARNGRALVASLEGEELAAALDELGFPELMTAEPSPKNSLMAPAWIGRHE